MPYTESTGRNHSLHWYTRFTGTLAPLVHSLHWYTRSTGTLAPLVHSLHWYTRFTGTLAPLVHSLITCIGSSQTGAYYTHAILKVHPPQQFDSSSRIAIFIFIINSCMFNTITWYMWRNIFLNLNRHSSHVWVSFWYNSLFTLVCTHVFPHDLGRKQIN